MTIENCRRDAAASLRKAWCSVAFLAVLYAFSFVDRMILALLAEQVSTSLHLSDKEMKKKRTKSHLRKYELEERRKL